MTILEALILSVVEGITEFLPISSTGHMILAADILKIPQSEFLKSFEIIIQLGAIAAVALLYFKRLVTGRYLLPRVFFSFIPAAVVGLVFYSSIKLYLLGNPVIVLVSLLTGGILLILIEKFFTPKQEHIEKMSTKNAVIIGVFQVLSIIPGVSRSAATIVGGLFVGLKRQEAVEFSFFLAIPTMLAATVLDVAKTSLTFTAYEYQLLAVGFAGAFLTAVITVKSFINFVRDHTFIPFGIYRIILAVVYAIFLLPR